MYIHTAIIKNVTLDVKYNFFSSPLFLLSNTRKRMKLFILLACVQLWWCSVRARYHRGGKYIVSLEISELENKQSYTT